MQFIVSIFAFIYQPSHTLRSRLFDFTSSAFFTLFCCFQLICCLSQFLYQLPKISHCPYMNHSSRPRRLESAAGTPRYWVTDETSSSLTLLPTLVESRKLAAKNECPSSSGPRPSIIMLSVINNDFYSPIGVSLFSFVPPSKSLIFCSLPFLFQNIVSSQYFHQMKCWMGKISGHPLFSLARQCDRHTRSSGYPIAMILHQNACCCRR